MQPRNAGIVEDQVARFGSANRNRTVADQLEDAGIFAGMINEKPRHWSDPKSIFGPAGEGIKLRGETFVRSLTAPLLVVVLHVERRVQRRDVKMLSLECGNFGFVHEAEADVV